MGRLDTGLADGLEDGPLRRELGVRAPVEVPQAYRPPAYGHRLVFSGRGSEYFRIWIVNLTLTLLSLGIYSAWAKVRKARWFAQHTALDGDRFDFHGEPLRILAGRVVALLLLLAWSWGFEFSIWLGLAVLALFCVAGPLLFAGAQRFKLANTSWRGLRFGFEVPRRDVYLVCVPMLLLWTAGSVLEAAGVEGMMYLGAGLAALIGLPWAHARLKRLQHSHARFGAQRFQLEPSTPEFYGLYAKALVLLLVGLMLAFLIVGLGTGLNHNAGAEDPTNPLTIWLWTAVAMLVGWMMAWPYFAARLQQVVWNRTTWGAVRFRGAMRSGELWRLVLGNTLLVLVTAGLYWPFAAVAVARYRVQSLSVESDEPLPEVRHAVPGANEQRSAGDGAADFFGLDLGW